MGAKEAVVKLMSTNEQVEHGAVRIRRPGEKNVFEVEYAGPGSNDEVLTITGQHIKDFAEIFGVLAVVIDKGESGGASK